VHSMMQQPVATCGPFVAVGHEYEPLSPTKATEPIEMLFGVC